MRAELLCACDLLRRGARAASALYDEALKPVDLRITQFSVLHALYRAGPLPITELALAVALERSTMGRNLAPLQRRGLVQLKVGADDRRQHVAVLTTRGEEAVRKALPLWRRVQNKVIHKIDYDAIRDIPEQLSGSRAR